MRVRVCVCVGVGLEVLMIAGVLEKKLEKKHVYSLHV